MKKLIAMVGVAVVLTGCSGDFNIKKNPDEANFDETYQGSPEIDLENAGEKEVAEPVVMEPEVVVEDVVVVESGAVATEETATGAVSTEETATGATTEAQG